MKGIDKLHDGEFNNMSQEWQPDGTVIITLSKRGEDKVYELQVKDLYGKDEKVLKERVIPVVIPDWIKNRVKPQPPKEKGKDEEAP